MDQEEAKRLEIILRNNRRNAARWRERLARDLRTLGKMLLRKADDVEKGRPFREGIMHGLAVSGASIDNLAGRIAELEEQTELLESILSVPSDDG